MKRIKILIADDHTIVRIGLTALLKTESDFEVVGEAKNGEAAVQEANRLKPDIVIMDLMMPKMDGVAATTELHKTLPTAKVIILTSFSTSDGIAHALAAGAAGAVLKTADDDDLVAAIRKVANGGRFVSPEIRRLLNEEPPVPDLTPRQKEILGSIIRGLTNKDIAKEFGIRPDSVDRHVIAVFAKLGAANRAEAVAIALRKHLLKI